MDNIQPLGQTFKVDVIGGCFLTSVDLFFYIKTKNQFQYEWKLEMLLLEFNQRVLPHSTKVLETVDINVDEENGSVPTTFTFDSPVFVQEGTRVLI